MIHLDTSILFTQYHLGEEGTIEIAFTPDTVSGHFYLAEGRNHRTSDEEMTRWGYITFGDGLIDSSYSGSKEIYELSTGRLVPNSERIVAGKAYKVVVSGSNQYIRHCGNRFKLEDDRFRGKIHYIKVTGSSFGYAVANPGSQGAHLPSLLYQFDHINTSGTPTEGFVVKNLDTSVPEVRLLGASSPDKPSFNPDNDTFFATSPMELFLFSKTLSETGTKNYERVLRVEVDLTITTDGSVNLLWEEPGRSSKVLPLVQGPNVVYIYVASSKETDLSKYPRLELEGVIGISNFRVYESHDCMLPPTSEWVNR